MQRSSAPTLAIKSAIGEISDFLSATTTSEDRAGGDSLFESFPSQLMETVVRVSHESFDWRTFLIPTGWSESVRDQRGGTIARVMHLHIARYAVSKVSHEGCDWSKKSKVLRVLQRLGLIRPITFWSNIFVQPGQPNRSSR